MTDIMTNREAINILRVITPPRESKRIFDKFIQARDMAISALEKQEQDRWHSVAKEGNPKEEKLYIVTKKLNYGNGVIKHEVSMDRWSRNGFGKEWSYNSNSLIVAWRPFPEPHKAEDEA